MRLILATGIVLAGLAASSAQADTAKFYSGGAGYTGPFNGAGSVYDSTQALPTNCPGGGSGCAGGPDIISSPQAFTTSVPITASATVGGAVWNDLEPNFGGLGVGLAAQGPAALWVKSRHCDGSVRCPLYPRKRTFIVD